MASLSKTQLNKTPKGELVKLALASQKEVEHIQEVVKAKDEQVTHLETVIQMINDAIEQLLIDIDLPRKFSFWWVISNSKEIIKFVSSVVTALKVKKEIESKLAAKQL